MTSAQILQYNNIYNLWLWSSGPCLKCTLVVGLWKDICDPHESLGPGPDSTSSSCHWCFCFSVIVLKAFRCCWCAVDCNCDSVWYHILFSVMEFALKHKCSTKKKMSKMCPAALECEAFTVFLKEDPADLLTVCHLKWDYMFLTDSPVGIKVYY